jgi:hypothetical protein
MLLPSAKDGVDGPGAEENLALIQAIFGQNDRAISTLSRLLQTPFQSQLYGPMPLTPAFSQTRSALGLLAHQSRFRATQRVRASRQATEK